MAGRASIVGAAVTHVGKVRDHNEDAHLFDSENGVFLVCDGMGGHAAGEVAAAIAIQTIRATWSDDSTHGAIDSFLSVGTPDAKKRLLNVLRAGVIAAHDAIIAEAKRDETKTGMGTTLVGAIVVGGDVIFAHAGDSRAYLVRDNIAMQLTEDHTLLSRLLAAGIDVDLTGDGARFKSMLTNALGIGQDCKVSTFVVPLADGDRFLLCSDGISEYIKEAEVGEVLSKSASPSRAAQKLVDLALERGGGDNATALVVRVLEAGESPLPVERRKRDDDVIAACTLWGLRVNPQQRLRALRIAIPRDHCAGDKVPAQTLGDRVAWIVLEGEVEQDGKVMGAATLLYPEALIATSTVPDRDGLATAVTDVRALAIRADDFKEICDEDVELGEALMEALVNLIGRRPIRRAAQVSGGRELRGRAKTDPGDPRDPDAETTAILTGPPTPSGSRRVDDSTQPLTAIGRSDTMPAVAGNQADPLVFGRVPTRPLHPQRSPGQEDEEIEIIVIDEAKQTAVLDGGAVLRALWKDVPDETPDIAPAPPPGPAPKSTAGDATQPLQPFRPPARLMPNPVVPIAATLAKKPVPPVPADPVASATSKSDTTQPLRMSAIVPPAKAFAIRARTEPGQPIPIPKIPKRADTDPGKPPALPPPPLAPIRRVEPPTVSEAPVAVAPEADDPNPRAKRPSEGWSDDDPS